MISKGNMMQKYAQAKVDRGKLDHKSIEGVICEKAAFLSPACCVVDFGLEQKIAEHYDLWSELDFGKMQNEFRQEKHYVLSMMERQGFFFRQCKSKCNKNIQVSKCYPSNQKFINQG
jgi:hypothetical protein